MSLKNYFAASVGVFVLFMVGAHYASVPVVPIAAILLVGETLLGFEVEDHKVGRALKQLFTSSRPHHH